MEIRTEKNTQWTRSKSRKPQIGSTVDYAAANGGSVFSLSTNGGLLSGIWSKLYTSPTINSHVHAWNTDIIVNDSESDEESNYDVNE